MGKIYKMIELDYFSPLSGEIFSVIPLSDSYLFLCVTAGLLNLILGSFKPLFHDR